MEWKLLLYDLSPYINSFESMAISFFFFFMDLHVPTFFSFFSILGPSCVHIFFSIAHASLFFSQKLERETNTYSRAFILWNEWWYNANFSKKHSKGVYGMHVNLDHESMKRILSRVTTILQSSMQNKQHKCIRSSRNIIIWLW